jgi:heptosyltransferase-2
VRSADPGVRPVAPGKIFVLRNNDIGDLLIVTPVFEALKRNFPNAKVVAGVGAWNLDVLKLNPFIDEVLEINAPWANKYTANQGLRTVLNYVFCSPEVNRVKDSSFDVGIDILGSHFGAMLLMRAEIPLRLGVTGYRGGDAGFHKSIAFSSRVHVGAAALHLAALLGSNAQVENRPQLFLSVDELEFGERLWTDVAEGSRYPRILLGPSGGFPEKCWPRTEFRDLVAQLEGQVRARVIVVGAKADFEIGQFVCSLSVGNSRNMCGDLSLRHTFALAATSDFVVTNSSALMHIAAAFKKRTAVTLSGYYSSASDHDALWGYPGTCKSLGIEPGFRDRIWDHREVASYIAGQLNFDAGSDLDC